MKQSQIWTVQFWLILLCTWMMVLQPAWTISPNPNVRHLQVSCQNQLYEINDVTTVDDILKQLQRQSDLPKGDWKPACILYKGKMLERSDKLREKGVGDGEKVIVVSPHFKVTGKDYLALALNMFGNDDMLEKVTTKWKDDGVGEALQLWWTEVQGVQSQHVSQNLRASLDILYHRMRQSWEHPSLRNAMVDPTQIEAYRKVVANHLTKEMEQKLSSDSKNILQNPVAWRNKVLQVTSGLIRIGDIMLEGILEIVLDIVQGVGRNRPAFSSVFEQSSAKYDPQQQQQQQQQQYYEPKMEDPSLANQMLFELSESEDEPY